MDKALKTKWVKALRSGRYKQGKGRLLDHQGRYCCLGVLAKIQGCDLSKLDEDDCITEDLPKGLNAGLTKKTRENLARMNDGHAKTILTPDPEPKSFKEIADYIEKRL